ncbi:YciI family protein [Streptomyces sp. SID3343]|uniref:YciI family protein n=1 Tax=Streptomyces sp. SID3343 TaxID=2690260 RepID=UPI00136A71F0|nr:YciI family protein [Streptomyces sp. SID3343]MYW05895.1 YciI family protein [Streptomyces sp. SID3343]
MKYLLLIYSNPKNWGHPIFARTPEFLALPQDERDALSGQADALFTEISASGELVVGAALADPVLTRTVRVREGVPATTDGPYVEAKEQLAGYFVVDCDSPERAAEIAARFPDARFAALEVRPIMDMSGQEM